MDSKTFVLLEHLYEVCGQKTFRILDVQDLLPAGMAEHDFHAAVEVLKRDGYISVKYADQSEYCLGMLPKGVALVEQVREERARRAAQARAQLQAQVRAPVPEVSASPEAIVDEESASNSQEESAVSEAPDEAPEAAPVAQSGLDVGGKTVLAVWIAAFLGGILGGGVVALIMYLLQVFAQRG